MNMSKLCPKSKIHQSCTGCCWHPLPLLHNDITELLDVRHMVLLHLPLEDAPHVLNRVQVWRHTWPLHHLHLQLHQQGSCHLGGVFGVIIMLENCRSAQFLKGGRCFPYHFVRGRPAPLDGQVNFIFSIAPDHNRSNLKLPFL